MCGLRWERFLLETVNQEDLTPAQKRSAAGSGHAPSIPMDHTLMNFGKHQGTPCQWVRQNDVPYCQWILRTMTENFNSDPKLVMFGIYLNLKGMAIEEVPREPWTEWRTFPDATSPSPPTPTSPPIIQTPNVQMNLEPTIEISDDEMDPQAEWPQRPPIIHIGSENEWEKPEHAGSTRT